MLRLRFMLPVAVVGVTEHALPVGAPRAAGPGWLLLVLAVTLPVRPALAVRG